ncbi:hypothetical protein ACIQNU_24050 [Streptomyces sp. NPDC091292]|uniref:hypothetical protein n=1 Tax=Streptomyces sp. NPDC091292 TaxID=3365991 RepID=UPI00380BFFBC
MTPGRCFRAVRAAVFAVTCVLLAVLGHVLMSGTAVPWWAMVVAFCGTAAGAWALADRERGLFLVTSAAVVVQAALHSGFSLAQAATRPAVPDDVSFAQQWARYLLCGADAGTPLSSSDAARLLTDAGLGGLPQTPPPGGGGAAMAGAAAEHAHHTAQAMAGGSAMPAGHDMAGMSPSGMLAAHLLAAVLCGLWLAHGEQGAFRLLRACAGWFAAPLRLALRLPAPPHRPRVRIRRDDRTHPLHRLLRSHVITSRGPPTGIAVG